MVRNLFENNIVIYTFMALCVLGTLLRITVNLVYKHLIKESDKLGETKNKMLMHMKAKFSTCYKLKIGVNNVDTFVDKSVLKYRFCGLLLSTWDNAGGQVLFLNLLMVPVITIFGVAYECGQDQILMGGAVGILTSAILILVDKSINITGKKELLNLNLLDYLENFCKVRLEQESAHPELVEQYRREYNQAMEAGKQTGAAAAPVKKADPKDELNRRREARLKKEEEKKLQSAKREEEARKAEEARKQEEQRKIEERKQQAAKRREEERLRLEEEQAALEARRAEMKKKAAEKQLSNEKKQQKAEEQDKILHSLPEDLKPLDKKAEINTAPKVIDETAAVKGPAKAIKPEKTLDETENAALDFAQSSIKEKQQKASVKNNKSKEISVQEDKLIEDVLKEFFA